MNADLMKLWLRYIDGERLDSQQESALAEQLGNDKVASHFLEERQLDGLLRLMAETELEQQQFVAGCVDKFVTQANTTDQDHDVEHGFHFENSATDFVADVALGSVGEDAAKSVDQFAPVQRRDSISTRPAKKSPFRIALVVAAGLMVPLAGLFWLTQSFGPQSGGVVKNQPQNQSTKSGSDGLGSAITDFQNRAQEPFVSKATPRIILHNTDLIDESVDKNSGLDGAAVAQAPDRLRNPGAAPENLLDQNAFATVVSSPNARWRNKPQIDHLGQGRYVLDDGTARLDFRDGSTVQVTAPIDFEVQSPSHIVVNQGNITASIAANSDDFSVGSPAADFTRGGASQFHLAVSPDGRSEALLHRGSLDLVRHQRGQERADPWNLSAKQLNQVMVDRVENAPSPALCMARGNDEFRGSIDVGGNAIEINSPEMFASVVDRIENAQTNSPQELQDQWDAFVNRFQKQGLAGSIDSGQNRQPFETFEELFDVIRAQQEKMGDTFGNNATQFQGSINVNGRQQQFDSLEDLRRMQSELLGPMFDQMRLPPGIPNTNFQGVININGREMKFTSPEDFRKAKQQFLRK